MGVAGTAPAFSLAATLTTLIAAVGILAVPSLLYSGLIMFGVTLAFIHLTRINTSAGASFTWVGEIFHPLLGFLCGWSLLVASSVFMVSGSMPAATATLALVAPQYLNSPGWVSGLAAAWLVLVGIVVIKGIKATSYTQIVFTVIEVGSLGAIMAAAWLSPTVHPAHTLVGSSFGLSAFTPKMFVAGALISLFFFWGWDVTLNLNEETQSAETSARKALYGAMAITLLLYVSFAATALRVLTDNELAQAGTNVIYVVASRLFPHPWSYVALIAVTLSTVGNLETSILQFTRTLYAKSRSGALHPRYALLHASWQTPWVATLVVVGLGLCFLLGASYFPSVKLVIADSVNAIGFQVCFYYSLTAFACVWRFRHEAVQSPATFLDLLFWPLVSGLFLVFIAVESVPTFDTVTNVIGLGGIVLGLIPWIINQKRRTSQSTA
ncbi:MAG: APC family permease [Pseudomonadales bacterium]|nr:APC family permease [Pseudomonadales bacterium]